MKGSITKRRSGIHPMVATIEQRIRAAVQAERARCAAICTEVATEHYEATQDCEPGSASFAMRKAAQLAADQCADRIRQHDPECRCPECDPVYNDPQ